MSPSPTLEGSWGIAAANTMTAWTGPWGVSFTANLTPDKETGLGDWTEEMFIQTMRTGRHQGKDARFYRRCRGSAWPHCQTRT